MRVALASLAFLISILILILPSTAQKAHNITRILANYPEFSTFNRYLTLTHLAEEINRRHTITVLAVDNAAMSGLLSKNLSIYTMKHVLSLHILVDYFSAKKLHKLRRHSISTASMFQTTGATSGPFGYINITDLKAGKVGFRTNDQDKLNALFVKSVRELPYNLSIIQVSGILSTAIAEAPAPAPSFEFMHKMYNRGCKSFADLLTVSGTRKTFEDNVDEGLTVFCPSNAAMKGFMTKYNNLSVVNQSAVLLYHGIPDYKSMQMLVSSKGVIKTLATDKADKYHFTVQNDGDYVSLDTQVITAKITGTLTDEEPLVVYKINKVLLPIELFTPEPIKSSDDSTETDDERVHHKNGAIGFKGHGLVVVLLSLCSGVLFI